MIDKDKEQQWDREMAQVDRLLQKLPTYAPKGAAEGEPTLRRPVSGPVRPAPGSSLGARLRVGLALALAVGMTIWPYSHVCGLKLFFYLGGVGVLTVAGAWGMASSWRHRLGLAHVVSLATVLWGLVLAAGVVLPRVGYARTTAIWFCPEPAPPAAPAPR